MSRVDVVSGAIAGLTDRALFVQVPLPPKEPPFKLPPCYAVNAKLLPVHLCNSLFGLLQQTFRSN